MANPAVGRILCPICGTDGEVRRYKGSERGKLYWACDCGQIRPALAVGQAYIERNMRPLDAAPAAAPPEAKPREQAPSARPAAQTPPPAKPERRGGFLSILNEL